MQPKYSMGGHNLIKIGEKYISFTLKEKGMRSEEKRKRVYSCKLSLRT